MVKRNGNPRLKEASPLRPFAALSRRNGGGAPGARIGGGPGGLSSRAGGPFAAFGCHAKYRNQPFPPGIRQVNAGPSPMGGPVGGAGGAGGTAGAARALGGRRQNFNLSISAGLSASLSLNLILGSCRLNRSRY